MKDIPILMTTDMVCATLDSIKTKTRRIVKDQDDISTFNFIEKSPQDSYLSQLVFCPYGQPGDRLYVRETWQHSNWPHGPYDDDCEVFYRADYANDPHGFDGEKSPEGNYRFWNPSIHLPRSRSRLFLRVTDIRVERLQDITEADAQAEGAMFWAQQQDTQIRHLDGRDARFAFIALWESINGPSSWDVNPWVWVISFEKVAA